MEQVRDIIIAFVHETKLKLEISSGKNGYQYPIGVPFLEKRYIYTPIFEGICIKPVDYWKLKIQQDKYEEYKN